MTANKIVNPFTNTLTLNGAIQANTIISSSINTGSITTDRSYSKSFLDRQIRHQIDVYRNQISSEYTDDEYDAGFAAGYDAGMLDGMQYVLDSLDTL